VGSCCEFSAEGCSQSVHHTSSTTSGESTQDLSLPDLQVDAFLTRLQARLSSQPPIYDQSFATPFADAVVQAAVTTASGVLNAAAAPQSATIGGPNLLGSSTTSETGPPVVVGDYFIGEGRSITSSTTFGPATILIASEQSQTCFVRPGDANVNVNTHTQTFDARLLQATTTHLLSELYELVGSVEVEHGILDVDGDGEVEPLTDGLLILRHRFGITGASLVAAAVDLANCTRCTAAAIETYLAAVLLPIDIDSDGAREPLTDALLILRYLFGFTGATLVNGAVDLINCHRCSAAEIEAYIQSLDG
jgi:hypothetical protein